MRIIKPSCQILWPGNRDAILKRIERSGRVAYRSENRITKESASAFVQKIVVNGHHSVLEHVSVSVEATTDRGISHEIVRHRIAAYTQESTRACDYQKEKFKGQIDVVLPSFFWELKKNDQRFQIWLDAMKYAEGAYLGLRLRGVPPEVARSVLPTCLRTKIFITYNLREWKHFFSLRAVRAAHPDMQVIARNLLKKFQTKLPEIFGEA